MLQHHFRALTGALITGLCSLSLHAQMAQSPLLAKTQGQVPNIAFVFDDSGSMPATSIYQYGTKYDGMGAWGPGVTPGNGAPPAFYGQSPNVNLIYYDPRETYSRRINADGSYMVAGTTSPGDTFPVYFYKPPSTNLYSVASVSVTKIGSNYPSSGVTGSFTAAPSGGTTATATVTTAPSGTAGSVTVNSIGSNYPATGVTATFSAPDDPRGIRSTGTVQIGSTGKVNTVTVASYGSGYNATGVTATFSAPQLAGGTTATGTPVISSTRTVASVAVTNGGSGYSNGSAVNFSVPPFGVAATGTANTISYNVTAGNVPILAQGSGYTAASATIVGTRAPWGTASTCNVTRTSGKITQIACTAGTGYLSTPTLSFSGTGGSGASIGTLATTTTNNKIVSVTVTTPGSGYTVNPTVTGVSGGGSGAAFTVTNGPTTNSVTGFNIGNRGSGYTSPPTITLSSPGTGAAFTVTTVSTNYIAGITITEPGSGYSNPQSITLAGVGTGTGASFTVNAGTTNVIQSVTVTDGGSGYTATPTFTISSPAPGAGGLATVTPSAPTVILGVNQDWKGVPADIRASTFYFDPYIPGPENPLAPGATVLPYPVLASSATANYPKFKGRSDCITSTTSCTWAEEQQNYANWKTYHSTRLELAKTGIGLAFQPLTATFRLAWATISSDLDQNSRMASGVRLYDVDTRTSFFNWLYARTGTNNTPNRNAINKVGLYYMRKDDAGPWGAHDPLPTTTAVKGSPYISTNPATGTANPNHASCRRNYAVLMTDGYYNETYTQLDSDTTTGQTDGAGNLYVPIGPYSDTKSGTAFANGFSDVTHKYWLKSLRPDFVKQKTLDEKPTDKATWPHMNFYAIGLGLVGTLDATSNDVLTSLSGTSSRTLDWPTPTANNPKAIDDMWHATINGRGLLLNAASASNLQKSILRIISDIGGLEGTQAGVAASATSLTTTTKKFTPRFTSQYWTGNVEAYFLDQVTADQVSLAWEVESLASTDPVTGISTYTSKIPAYNLRNIMVGNGATSGTRAIPFTKTDMDAAGLTSKMGGTVTTDLINYLRGDAGLEATDANASNPGAIFRARQKRLGDVVNSTPVFVRAELDAKYDTVPNAAGYRTFVTNKTNQRTEGVLFVGANDGMLHVFRDGATTAGGNSPSSSTGGVEVFAYVPRAVLPAMSALADPFYGADASHPHRYFVDGPSVEADVYLPGASRWANIVLGSTGAGAGTLSTPGKSPQTGIFAIDTTSLNTSVASLNASSVLWEVGSDPSAANDFSELGYVTSKIETGPMLDGSWVAIFGNGFESASCKAQLFIVNVETGALIKKIDTFAGACGASKNGLGGVALVRNADRQIIGAYAGDLLGNAWKFNLNDASPGNWKVDFGGDPLYKAKPGQPITATPSVIDLATTPDVTTPKPGYMVVFETGKFTETTDLTTTSQQAIYGVWDDKLFGEDQTLLGSPRVIESQLQPRTSSDIADGTIALDYTTKKGWYYNFAHVGERMVFPMNVVVNRFVRGTSLTPVTTGSGDPCESGSAGEGRPYTIDALSGKSIPEDNIIIPPEPPPPPFVDCTTDPTKCTVISITSDPTAPPPVVIPCELTNTCVILPNTIKRRQWRQLFPR